MSKSTMLLFLHEQEKNVDEKKMIPEENLEKVVNQLSSARKEALLYAVRIIAAASEYDERIPVVLERMKGIPNLINLISYVDKTGPAVTSATTTTPSSTHTSSQTQQLTSQSVSPAEDHSINLIRSKALDVIANLIAHGDCLDKFVVHGLIPVLAKYYQTDTEQGRKSLEIVKLFASKNVKYKEFILSAGVDKSILKSAKLSLIGRKKKKERFLPKSKTIDVQPAGWNFGTATNTNTNTNNNTSPRSPRYIDNLTLFTSTNNTSSNSPNPSSSGGNSVSIGNVVSTIFGNTSNAFEAASLESDDEDEDRRGRHEKISRSYSSGAGEKNLLKRKSAPSKRVKSRDRSVSPTGKRTVTGNSGGNSVIVSPSGIPTVPTVPTVNLRISGNSSGSTVSPKNATSPTRPERSQSVNNRPSTVVPIALVTNPRTNQTNYESHNNIDVSLFTQTLPTNSGNVPSVRLDGAARGRRLSTSSGTLPVSPNSSSAPNTPTGALTPPSTPSSTSISAEQPLSPRAPLSPTSPSSTQSPSRKRDRFLPTVFSERELSTPEKLEREQDRDKGDKEIRILPLLDTTKAKYVSIGENGPSLSQTDRTHDRAKKPIDLASPKGVSGLSASSTNTAAFSVPTVQARSDEYKTKRQLSDSQPNNKEVRRKSQPTKLASITPAASPATSPSSPVSTSPVIPPVTPTYPNLHTAASIRSLEARVARARSRSLNESNNDEINLDGKVSPKMSRKSKKKKTKKVSQAHKVPIKCIAEHLDKRFLYVDQNITVDELFKMLGEDYHTTITVGQVKFRDPADKQDMMTITKREDLDMLFEMRPLEIYLFGVATTQNFDGQPMSPRVNAKRDDSAMNTPVASPKQPHQQPLGSSSKSPMYGVTPRALRTPRGGATKHYTETELPSDEDDEEEEAPDDPQETPPTSPRPPHHLLLSPLGASQSGDIEPKTPKPKESVDSRWIIKPSDLIFPSDGILGKGFFGEVRKGFWRGTPVACKFVFEKSFRNKTDNDLFIQEVKIMSELRHPNVILYLGVCLSGNSKIIVTEFMDNGSLHDFIRESPLTDRLRWSITRDIALGMRYLHEEDILHRDLTSRNILLNSHMQAKVSDFGLSKHKLTDVGASYTMGSVAWMAPEVIQSAKSFSPKSDVFSFAIVTWELFTCEEPIPNGISAVNHTFKVINEKYRPPIADNMSLLWQNLITKCWSQLAEDRPSFGECLDLLIHIEEEISTAELEERKRKKGGGATAGAGTKKSFDGNAPINKRSALGALKTKVTDESCSSDDDSQNNNSNVNNSNDDENLSDSGRKRKASHPLATVSKSAGTVTKPRSKTASGSGSTKVTPIVSSSPTTTSSNSSRNTSVLSVKISEAPKPSGIRVSARNNTNEKQNTNNNTNTITNNTNGDNSDDSTVDNGDASDSTDEDDLENKHKPVVTSDLGYMAQMVVGGGNDEEEEKDSDSDTGPTVGADSGYMDRMAIGTTDD